MDIKRRSRSLAIVIIFLIAGTGFVNVVFYNSVANRVEALRGSAAMLADTIRADANNSRASVEYWVGKGIVDSKVLNGYLENATTFQDVNEQNVNKRIRYIHGYIVQSAYLSNLTNELAQELVTEENTLREKGFDKKGTSFEALLFMTTELVNSTKKLETTFSELVNATDTAKAGSEEEMNALRMKGIELTDGFYQMMTVVKASIATLAAGDVNVLAPFVLVGVLYTVFLLFPWLILLLFFLRKRDPVIRTKIKMFEEMDLGNSLPDLLEEEKKEASELSDEEIRNLSKGEQEKLKNEKEKAAKFKKWIERQAFRDKEYYVSLVLLTSVTAILFYFFFYPNASAGLAYLISQGGGVKAFANYLATEATPITFGFIGAYFWVIQSLLRRYFAADLNPNAYTYAVVRILTVFIISIVLQLGTSAIGLAQFPIAVVAFAVGIFPESGINWILLSANKGLEGFKTPETLEVDRLTKLEGLNTWHEARLLEAKVENVQNLATASLENLIVDTNFYPSQLIDWLDQALLYIHTKERWIESFQSVGIRTASDFLDNIQDESNNGPDPTKAERLTTAINASQVFTPKPEHPRSVAMLAAAELYKSVADVADKAKKTHALSKGLDAQNPETLDAIKAVNGKMVELEKLVKLSDSDVKEIDRASNDPSFARNGSWDKKVREANKSIQESWKEFNDKFVLVGKDIKQLDRKKPEELANLPKVKERLDSCIAAVTNYKAQVVSASKIATGGIDDQSSDQTTKKECKALLKGLNKAEKDLGDLLKKAQELRSDVSGLDKDKPSTLNKIAALQTNLKELNEAANDAQSKIIKAQTSVEELLGVPSLVTEARKSLAIGVEPIEKLVKITTEAKDAGAPLDIDKPDTLNGLSLLKELVESADTSSKDVKTKCQTAAEAIQKAATPPKMTKEIIETMYVTINEGPNIKSIQKFWAEHPKKDNKTN